MNRIDMIQRVLECAIKAHAALSEAGTLLDLLEQTEPEDFDWQKSLKQRTIRSVYGDQDNMLHHDTAWATFTSAGGMVEAAKSYMLATIEHDSKARGESDDG